MEIPNITIGCDPEIFLSKEPDNVDALLRKNYANYVAYEEKFIKLMKDSNTYKPYSFEEWSKSYDAKSAVKPRFFSAHGLIPGTKAEPFPVMNGAIQVDGVALEFNINPASTEDEFAGNIQSVLDQMRGKLNRPDLYFEFKPTAWFQPDYWATIPDEAKVLGCEPDYNGYTLEPNPKPETDKPFRTASGHIHIGWTADKDPKAGEHISDCGLVARQLDMVLGVHSHEWDSDLERQKLYGKPGAFRAKSYGMEYRPLSNAWLRLSPESWKSIFHNSKLAIELLFNGDFLPGLFPTVSKSIENRGFNSAYYRDYEFGEMLAFLQEKGWRSII